MIQVGGISIGTMDAIELITDTTLRMNMCIKSEVLKFMKRDVNLSIGTEGLMGDRVLLISPGTTSLEPVKENEALATHSPVENEQILGQFKDFSRQC
jgi:phospholipid/cholesterol/gamma-HCH transport system substrate-binding protein